MKILIVVGLLGMAAAFVLPEYGSCDRVTAISDTAADAITGGGCGYKWKSGTAPCPTGTVLCGDESEACSDITATSLVTDGDGDEKVRTTAPVACAVCGTSCGNASTVTKTGACASS